MDENLVQQIKQGKLDLRNLFTRLIDDFDIADSKWSENYRQLTGTMKKHTPLDDQHIQTLWYAQENGVSSMRLGRLSWDEFTALIPDLRALTEAIRQNPDAQQYERAYQLFQQWKKEKRVRIMHRATINRVFAAMAPEYCSTIINQDLFNRVAHFLNGYFNLRLSLSGNWLLNNHELKTTLNNCLPEMNPLLVNMALWHLYTLLAESDTPKVEKLNILVEADKDSARQASSTVKMDPPRNQIYYGPPGTGKTYHLQQEMKKYTSQADVPDLLTWLDSRLAELNWMEVIALVLLDNHHQATVQQILDHGWFQRKALLNARGDNPTLKNTAWHYLQTYTIPESTTVNMQIRREPAIFDKLPKKPGKQVEWILVDSRLEEINDLVALHQELKTGPQQSEVITRYATATFHQSYGYEEFIEGMRAKTDDDDKVSYSIEPGVFKSLCVRAKLDPEHRYAMFIDEINRGNISKIFGELISLIEVDKRTGMENALSVQLSYSGKPFSVPVNVDIIGAMNTADRSLALMDTALRRRFDFIEMMPNIGLLSDVNINGIDLEPLLEKINLRIEALYDREHTLGHAFFIPVKRAISDQALAFSELQRVFQKKIVPLLQEYFYDDWAKIRLVLADNQKPQHLQFIDEIDDDYSALFGEGYADTHHQPATQRYQLKNIDDEVWSNPLAWRGIYLAVNDVNEPEA